MRTFITSLIVLAMLACVAGCSNVHVKGEALTALETSALDAYQAAQRAESESAWQRAYIQENYHQWRFFVRAARKDDKWGPRLEGE